MPLSHQGALSGVTYTIPALRDVRDPSKAFADFADSLPATAPAMTVHTVTATGSAAANTLNLYAGTTPITITLPSTGQPGQKVAVAQLGTGVVTVSGVGGGVPVTAGANTAVTAVWDGAKWVGLPFSFSGTRPTQSTGGTIVDLNGFRYHRFDTPGTFTFTSHKALNVEVLVVGPGADGTAGSTTAAGTPGGGGAVAQQAVSVGDWTFTPVVVGDSGGAQSEFAGVTAAGGTLGGATAATALTGDWATVAQKATVGGPGPVGFVNPATYGVGGAGGFHVLVPYTQETETYSYTTGGPYTYDCSYGARAEQYQSGSTTVMGDPCVNGQCPGGWDCRVSGQSGMLPTYNCFATIPQYDTRYHCDSGGSLSGTTCVKTCSGDNTQHHTGTRPKACNSGYVASNGMCVDPRSPDFGKGGTGLVIIRYAIP